MTEDANHLEANMMAFMENKSIEQIEQYLSRGRVHEHEQIGLVKERWVALFRAYVHQPHDGSLAQPMHDLEVEIMLRQEAVPSEVVAHEEEELFKRIEAASDAMTAQEEAEANETIMLDLNFFLGHVAKQKKS